MQGQPKCAEFVVDRRTDVEMLFTHGWKLDRPRRLPALRPS
jgi:hypothetical protein